MKNVGLIVMSLLVAGGFLLVTSCGDSQSSNDEKQSENIEQKNSSQQQEEVIENNNLSLILSSYFEMTESLFNDAAIDAAEASEKLRSSLDHFEDANLSENELEEVGEILESSIEHAEHISENAGDIHHQREHLVLLSLDIKDLIEIVGSDQKLYEAYCPMANNDKGAIWVTNKNEVENPYMGQGMPKCGKISSEIN